MKVEFIEQYDINLLKPADYNPRKLEEDKFIKLQESIQKFGIIKPLIINGDNGVLTAGHQRTRTIKKVGINKAPVIRINKIKIQDEIKFNLFHNSIETNKSKVHIKNINKTGYHIIDPKDITFSKNENATVVKEIGKLIIKYGEWGSIVATEDGKVILNSDYAVASKQLNKQMICYIIKNEDKEELIKYLSIDYGMYCYDSLNIKSYNQLYCQMNRLVKGKKKPIKSTTYERYVIPIINKNMRILDFGAGKCAYVNMLKSKGYNIFAYEPNFQGKNNNINIKEVIKQLKKIEQDVKNNGLYDLVVLDSVLNSVVSNEVENYVLATCNAFLKEDGMFITGTRNIGKAEKSANLNKTTSKTRELEFLDKNNFSATFRNGVWTMQHFHSKQTLKKLLNNYYDDVKVYGNNTSSQVYAIATKPKALNKDYLRKALEFELNMEYPNGFKHNKHKKLLEMVLKAR